MTAMENKFRTIRKLHVVDREVVSGLVSIIDHAESCVPNVILRSASAVTLGHDDRSRYRDVHFLDSPRLSRVKVQISVWLCSFARTIAAFLNLLCGDLRCV